MTPLSSRRRRLLALFLAAVAGLALIAPAVPSSAASTTGARQLVKGGFGEGAENAFSWSMAWFKGKLYVGTGRSQLCVERATYDFYFPGKGYSQKPAPDVSCPADRYDLDLRAEIWQYTPRTNAWKRVYQAPADIPNPRAPGKFLSRDIGYRGMTVFTEPDGTSALYVGGVTSDEYIPEIAAAHPPRLLRTTDGENFAALPGGPGVVQDHDGPTLPIGFRALTPFRGRLYVTASSGLLGDGVVMEVRNPASAHPEFVQVSPAALRVFDMEVFNNRLYVGGGDKDAGYSVWRTDPTVSPATFTPIVTGGAGRGKTIDSVVSMHVYQGRLYVGASGWNSLLPGSELIRIAPSDRWELVVGNPRTVDGRVRRPASGLTDGFGNLFNAHFWRMDTDKGGLYLGTNDWSYALRTIPVLDRLIRPLYGFDVYRSCDGTSWSAQTVNAFGDGTYNFGLRTLTSTSRGLFLGSTNHVQGTSVFLRNQGGCLKRRPLTGSRAAWREGLASTLDPTRRVPPSTDTLAAPTLSRAQPASCGTVVSWQPSAGATRYVVSRAVEQSVTGAALQPPLTLPNGFRLTSAPTAVKSRQALTVLGPYTQVGVTTGTQLVDRQAAAGVRYQYSVVAVQGDQTSAAALVGPTPATGVADVRALVSRLAAAGELPKASAKEIRARLSEVTAAPAAGAETTAWRSLGSAVTASGATDTGEEDLGTAVYDLSRSLVTGSAACAR